MAQQSTSGFCGDKNPLQHGGTSRDERPAAGLRPDYVRLDEQSVADLLQYARRFAGRLQFYDAANQLNGDWTPFFSDDVSILIAALVQNRPADYEAAIAARQEEARQQLQDLYDEADGSGDLPPAIWDNLADHLPAFKQLFDLGATLMLHLDGQLAGLPETGLSEYADGLLARDGRRLLDRLLGIHKYAAGLGLSYLPADRREIQPLPPDLRPRYFQDLLRDGLEAGWRSGNNSLADYYDNVLDESTYDIAFGATPANRPEALEAHLRPGLDQLAGVLAGINKMVAALGREAAAYLEKTLTDWPTHEPHMALFLAFLRLYGLAQDHLNGLRDRHFRYYLEEVLRLSPRPARPAEVHLLVELAKQVENFLLPAGTALKAGKDPAGNPLQFTLPADSTFDRARVALLQSAYHTSSDGNLYTTSFTNSEDGLGAPPEAADGRWEAFGPVTRFRGPVDDPEPGRPRYEGTDTVQKETFQLVSQPDWYGMAVASPTLYLREGRRFVLLALQATAANPADPPDTTAWQPENFRYRFTTAEGWYEATPAINPLLLDGQLLFFLEIPPEVPAIEPYQADIHGGRMDTDAPVWQIRLLAGGDGRTPYNELRKFRISQADIRVLVLGARQLQVFNDFGPVDPAKSFQPFGPEPRRGSRLRIGSAEAFQKKGWLGLLLQFDWDGLDTVADPFVPAADPVQVIARRTDGSNPSAALNLLNYGPGSIAATVNLFLSPDYGRDQLQHTVYGDLPPFDTSTDEGYLVLELQGDLGHQAYRRDFPLALVQFAQKKSDRDATAIAALNSNFQIAGDNKGVVIPDAPYTPGLKGLSLTYGAQSTIVLDHGDQATFAARQERFFHSWPLGDREEHALRRQGGAVPLFPLFDNEGETYLGLTGALPRTVVQLLVQVAEGTANPLREVQTVDWAYLHEDQWQQFGPGEVVDGSDGLLQSGLVQLSLPRKISDNNRWLPPGMRWLRFSIGQHTDAVNDLLQIAAQGVRAVFDNQDNDLSFLQTPLPAGTVSKLLQPRQAVKKIEQPFDSFDGRPPEDEPAFYQRVSERLRHKDRAVAIWDYERLTLEHFPATYRVKCLNHTRLFADPADPTRLIEDEIAPGHVLVVAVPDQRRRQAVDPLRPYTSLSTLKQIGDMLRKRISPHVRLEVRNPVFEPVQLDFSVRFHPGRDPVQYTRLLNQALIEHLSPWAYDTQTPITFGGRIHKSGVLDFVEELPWVDYVLHFKMHQSPDDEENRRMDIETAEARSGRSILVSHHEHLISEAADCE